MELKLSNEETAKVFAMYLGAEVTDDYMDSKSVLAGVQDSGIIIKYNSYHQRRFNECQLLLTPLSAISDEHAIEVAKIICGKQYIDIENLKVKFEHTVEKYHLVIITFDAYQITKHTGDKPTQHRISISNWGVINHYITTRNSCELGNCCRSTYVFQELIRLGYAVALHFGVDHWANGKTAIELGIAINKTKQ